MHNLKFIPTWFRYLILSCLTVIIAGLIYGPRQSHHINNNLLYDRLWIDSMPEMSHDEFRAYMFTADNIGINFHGHSAFKLMLEVFEFRAKSDTINFHFPHDGLKEKASFAISPLDNPTEHFDTKLELSIDPKTGEKKAYFTGPELGSLEEMAPALRLQLLEELKQLKNQ